MRMILIAGIAAMGIGLAANIRNVSRTGQRPKPFNLY